MKTAMDIEVRTRPAQSLNALITQACWELVRRQYEQPNCNE